MGARAPRSACGPCGPLRSLVSAFIRARFARWKQECCHESPSRPCLVPLTVRGRSTAHGAARISLDPCLSTTRTSIPATTLLETECRSYRQLCPVIYVPPSSTTASCVIKHIAKPISFYASKTRPPLSCCAICSKLNGCTPIHVPAER